MHQHLLKFTEIQYTFARLNCSSKLLLSQMWQCWNKRRLSLVWSLAPIEANAMAFSTSSRFVMNLNQNRIADARQCLVMLEREARCVDWNARRRHSSRCFPECVGVNTMLLSLHVGCIIWLMVCSCLRRTRNLPLSTHHRFGSTRHDASLPSIVLYAEPANAAMRRERRLLFPCLLLPPSPPPTLLLSLPLLPSSFCAQFMCHLSHMVFRMQWPMLAMWAM